MSKKKTIIILTASVVIVATSIVVALAFSPQKPAKDPVKQSRDDRMKYMMSDEFSSLSDNDKKDYFQKLVKLHETEQKDAKQAPPPGPPPEMASLSEKQKEKLHENMHAMFRVMMNERVDRFYEKKTAAEKTAYLDKMIDERMEHHRRMQEHLNAMSEEDKNKMKEAFKKGKGPPRPSLSEMKKHLESSDPKERAKFSEFHQAMRERMKQRGITMRGPPPP